MMMMTSNLPNPASLPSSSKKVVAPSAKQAKAMSLSHSEVLHVVASEVDNDEDQQPEVPEAEVAVKVQINESWNQYSSYLVRQQKAKAQQDIQELWMTFQKQRDNVKLRDGLVMHYIHLVRYAVSRLPLNLPSSISTDDLMSFGTIGLLEAVKRFDPSRGLKFETYATNRIRGEIIDQLRSQDWVPRGVRKRNKLLMEAIATLEVDLGRNPTEAEIAAALGVTKVKLQAILAESTQLLLSLDEQLGSDSDGSSLSLLDTVADKVTLHPEAQLENGDTRLRLAESINALPEREKLLIALYYQENMTLREIGDIINVSESRVCQLHAQALLRLRQKLSKLMVN
ncbi:MAG: FliA/WhiG family RNA polymerase sigma factor [Candidatus Melainabacteria bacterium]|nr:FliA/WhiG family RNA polymerase sigma factor [Candidatus Melainabacteria bacterium]